MKRIVSTGNPIERHDGRGGWRGLAMRWMEQIITKFITIDLDGKELWQLKGMTGITTPTPLAQNGLLYVGSGFIADARQPLYAVRPGIRKAK